MSHVVLKLTPREARYLWGVVDGAADAGACHDGNTPDESRALNAISHKLLAEKAKWLPARTLAQKDTQNG